MASSKTMTKKEASHQCCVPYCPNNWGEDRKTNTKRSYHSFPSMPSRRELWLKAIDRGEDWQPNKYSCVCGDHFIGGRATIEEGSASYVPTIFPPKPPPTKPLPPKKPPAKKSKTTPKHASTVSRPASNVARAASTGLRAVAKGARTSFIGPRPVARGLRPVSAGPRLMSLVGRLPQPQVYTDNADNDDYSRPPSPWSDNDDDDVQHAEPINVQCILPGCINNALHDTKNGIERSYYTFPMEDKERLNLWLLAIPQSETMNITSLSWICSEHFIGGKKSDAKSSAGYVPTIFPNSRKRPGEALLNPVIAKQVHALSQSTNAHQGQRLQLASQPQLKPPVRPEIKFKPIRPKPADFDLLKTIATQGNVQGTRRLIIVQPGKPLPQTQPGPTTVPVSNVLQTPAVNTSTQAPEHSVSSADDVFPAQPEQEPDDHDSEETVSAGSPCRDDVDVSDDLLLSGLAQPKTEPDEPTVDSSMSPPGADNVGPHLNNTALTQDWSQLTVQADTSSSSASTVTEQGTKTPDNAEETKIKTEKMGDDERDYRCTVPGCLNNSMGDALLNVRRNYFTYPIEDPKRLKLWLQVIDRVSWAPEWNSKICSDHFAGGQKTDTLGSKGYFPMVALPAKRSSDTDEKIVQGQVVDFQSSTNRQTSCAKPPVRRTVRKVSLLKPKPILPKPAVAPSMEKPSMEEGAQDHLFSATAVAPCMEKPSMEIGGHNGFFTTTAGVPSMKGGQDPLFIPTARVPSMEGGQDPLFIPTAGVPSMEGGQDPLFLPTAGVPSMEGGQDPLFLPTAGVPSMEGGQDPLFLPTAGVPSLEKGRHNHCFTTTTGAPIMEKPSKEEGGHDRLFTNRARVPSMKKPSIGKGEQDHRFTTTSRGPGQGQFVIAKNHTPAPVSMFANKHASFHLNDPKSSATFSGHSNCEICIQGFEDTRQLENHLVLNHLKIKLLPKPRLGQNQLQHPSSSSVPALALPKRRPRATISRILAQTVPPLTQQAKLTGINITGLATSPAPSVCVTNPVSIQKVVPDQGSQPSTTSAAALLQNLISLLQQPSKPLNQHQAATVADVSTKQSVVVVKPSLSSNVAISNTARSSAVTSSAATSSAVMSSVVTSNAVTSSTPQPTHTLARTSKKLPAVIVFKKMPSSTSVTTPVTAPCTTASSDSTSTKKGSIILIKQNPSSSMTTSLTTQSAVTADATLSNKSGMKKRSIVLIKQPPSSNMKTSLTTQSAVTASSDITDMKKPAVVLIKQSPSSNVTTSLTTQSAVTASSDITNMKKPAVVLIKQNPSSSVTSLTTQSAVTADATLSNRTGMKKRSIVLIKQPPSSNVTTSLTTQSAGTVNKPAVIVIRPSPACSAGTPITMPSTSDTGSTTKPSVLVRKPSPSSSTASGQTSTNALTSQELTRKKLVLTPQKQSQVANKPVPLKGRKKSPNVIVPLVKPSAQSILHAKYRAKRKAMYIQTSALDTTLVDILEAKQAKRKEENKPTEPGQVVICHTCQSFHTSAAEFAAHMQRRHHKAADSKITCEVCMEEFVSYTTLMDHIFPLCPKARQGVLQCKPCDQSYPTPTELLVHLQAAHSEKHRWCYMCKPPARLHSPQALALHKSEIHNKKPTPRLRQCDVCGYRACYPSDLRVHMDSHKPVQEQKYRTTVENQCEVCGRMLGKNKSGLIRHMRTHTGDKPYSCLQCTKTFTNKPSLAIHMRYHNGVHLYSCDVCQKKFLVKKNITLAPVRSLPITSLVNRHAGRYYFS